jgi:hypothetical protein
MAVNHPLGSDVTQNIIVVHGNIHHSQPTKMDQPNVVLPKELRLAPPATMPQSRSYMFKQQAALSNYQPRDTIQINLPRLQRSYLTKDSYLEFEVTFSYKPSTTDPSLSNLLLDTPGAFGLIDRIEVYDYLGSTQLESTSGFGQLIALLQDTCVETGEYSTHWEVIAGGHGTQTVYDWERSSLFSDTSTSADCKTYRQVQPVTGEIIDQATWVNDANTLPATDSTTRTIRRKYHIPLFSFLGLLSPKYAPLHNGYTIMITLQSAANALISAAPKYSVAAKTVTQTVKAVADSLTMTLNAAQEDVEVGMVVTGTGISGTVKVAAKGTDGVTLTLDKKVTVADGASMTFTAAAGNPTSTTIITSTEQSFVVNNARMCCQILELGPIAESMLLSTTGENPMIIPTKAYRGYSTSFPEKTGTFKLDLNINVASLTNVLWMMRPTLHMNKVEYPTLSHRQRNFLESWSFQYGSSILPQTSGIVAFKPTSNDSTHRDSGSEALIELLKARHMYNQPTHTHAFNKANWAYDNVARARFLARQRIGSNTYVPQHINDFRYSTADSLFEHGKFACGLDLDLVSGRTNEIICGMNTNGMNTAISAVFNATAAGNAVVADADLKDASTGVWVESSQVDAWCEYDAFINISPGIATTVSF